MSEQKLTKSQEAGLKALIEGKNCFISGDAGTGKTFLINYFLANHCQDKAVLRCAYTALAADHMDGGRTLHSAFMIKEYPTVKDKDWSSGQDLSGYDILIIDEISMVRIDLFEGFMKTIKRASQKRAIWGKDPVQIILVGDFFQLPPIVTDDERKVIGEIYGLDDFGEPKIYAFESDAWKENNFHRIHLLEPVRQSDKNFINLLNEIKYLSNPAKTLETISALTSKQEFSESKAINLFASNKKVNECNQMHLNNIDEKEWVFKAQFNEDFTEALEKGWLKEKDIPVEKEIHLKPSARVMFTMNDQTKKGGKRRFQNGALGTIISIDEYEIEVKLDGEDETIVLELEQHLPEEERKYCWNVYDAPTCSKDKKVIQNPCPKTVWQVPLKLAYAITIHKSQGQTYDYVNFDPQEDDMKMQDGQLYVLLSRLKNIGGLYLINKIKTDQCSTSSKVMKFYNK